MFIAYPTALGRMPLPQLWAVLFFLMMVTVALDTDVSISCTYKCITAYSKNGILFHLSCPVTKHKFWMLLFFSVHKDQERNIIVFIVCQRHNGDMGLDE